MKTINIYPIKSSLHDEGIISNETSLLINKLNSENFILKIVEDINLLYQDCDLSLILVQSGGSENEFLKLLDKLRPPFYLLTYATNNSLAASLEILAFLKNNNLEGEVLHGDDNYLINRINNLLTKNDVIYDNLGVIGVPSDWLISCKVDKDVILNKFNVNLIDIPISEVEELYHQIKDVEVDEKYLKDGFDVEEIKKALRLYSALKKIVDKYSLKGFTIRCFDLLFSIKTTACLALSMFNDSKDNIAACEGDIPALIGMYIVKKLLNKPSFQANPSKIELQNKQILLAHCTIGLNMCDSFKLDTHYESNIGVGIHGEVKTGDITILRLNSNFDKCYLEDGTLIKNQYKDKLCRTQIICQFDNLDKILTYPLGNHLLIISGHNKDKLLDYLKNKNIVMI